MSRFFAALFALPLIAGCLCGRFAVAQDGGASSTVAAPAGGSGQQAPAYTLRTSTRVVLTDVTVTDAKGYPVRGLERSRFHVFDNNHPQQLASFEEHTASTTAAAARPVSAAPGTFSNDYLLTAPAASNILFLDTTTLGIVDQMYLNQQLERFLRTLPAGQPIAIYARSGEYTLLLQNFTDDHERLLTAIHRAIPHLPKPGALYANDYQTLQQIIAYLSQLPGRKNVLWFSGGSSFFLKPDAKDMPVGLNLQPLYDALEASRIAIYPIDARGLMASSQSSLFAQHMLMHDMAETTGGQAFYNNNGIAEIATHLVSTGANFYSLTYTPPNPLHNNKWHKVKVEVEGASYNVSYRRGYFDDGSNTSVPTDRPRTVLAAHGETAVLKDHDEPIVFRVRVLPQSEVASVSEGNVVNHVSGKPVRKDEVAYSVHFTAPLEGFLLHMVEGQPQVILGAGALAFNQDGRSTARVVQQFSIKLDPVKLTSTARKMIDFDQQINLPKGQEYLYVAVWDITTGRLGTVQVPLVVGK